MVDTWIAGKLGRTEVSYELPQLEPILADTYGVIAYQEQVMRISNVVAGFTLGEADVLRKAMGKKNPEVMAKMRGKFVEGAKKLGTNEKKATHLFDLMEHFAGYGFNKSHSTAYAFLAYQTAYLKANHPWHFAAALLTIEAQNTDKLALYLGECRDRGVPVLPPDINESQLRFTVTPQGVRFGLTAIKNVGEGAIEALLAVRKNQGRIASLHALCEELDLRLVNKRVFESLVKAGAFDSISGETELPTASMRPRLMAAIDAACEHGARLQRDRLEGRRSCSAGLGTAATTKPDARVQPVDGPGCPRRSRGPRPSSWLTRKRDARPVLDRASRGSLCSGAERLRREVNRRAGRRVADRAARQWVGTRRTETDRGRHQRRRDRRRCPAAQDAERRSHGRVHARGCRRGRRGDRVPRGLSAQRRA